MHKARAPNGQWSWHTQRPGEAPKMGNSKAKGMQLGATRSAAVDRKHQQGGAAPRRPAQQGLERPYAQEPRYGATGVCLGSTRRAGGSPASGQHPHTSTKLPYLAPN
jgi:hypothetical protein